MDLQATLPVNKSTVAGSIPAAVTGADIIFTCLGDDAAMMETVDTICKSGTSIANKLFVDCSTVHSDTTDQLAAMLSSHGAEFVGCPVFGAPAMADAGQLVCVLVGARPSVKKVLPFCKGVMGRANIDYSDQPCGRATLLKVIGNSFILNMVETLSEGHTIAEKSGLGNDNLHQVIEAMFLGPPTAYSGRMIGGDYYRRAEPLFGS
ncbi:MAG: hypothetical protein L6R35_003635 [Caloplaca aegaea]|nr:MAG: hypothetical protein L6R35_003635 [Caloplaca aegaea]